MQSFFPKAVETTTGHISEVERSRSVATHRLRIHDEVREVPRELAAFAHVVGETCAEERAIQTPSRRHLNTLTIERSAISAFGGEEFVTQRIVNHANFQAPVMLQPD